MSGWWDSIFSNGKVFPDLDPTNLNILHGHSEMYDQIGFCLVYFSPVISLKLMIFEYYKDYFLENRKSLKTLKPLSIVITAMLSQLPFYDELSIVETSKAFNGYARS